MLTTCRQNKAHFFEITQDDLLFYAKMEVPPPTLCPDCRVQRRMAFRNFRNLYERKCDYTGRQMISKYAPLPATGKPFIVYDQDIWWSDNWDATDYGVDFDFQRPFFDQMGELMQRVPKFNVHNINAENCQYSNLVFGSRNCYLIFGCIKSEDCYYGHIVWESKNCVDCLYILSCELCYDCVDCLRCYNLKWSRDSEDCRDSSFLLDCKSCSDCFGCVGLRQKQYYIFNQAYTKEQYFERMKQFDSCNPAQMQKAREIFQSLALKHPFLSMHASQADNCSGDYIYQSKNIQASFDIKRSEDLKYAYTIKEFKDSYDVNFSGQPTELAYESLTIEGLNIRFSHLCLDRCQNLTYCDCCFNCKDCFGCSGLRNKQYCILNKQYTKEEYEALVPKIIEHMKETPLEKGTPPAPSLTKRGIEGAFEWGEFFPMRLSPFGYNETVAAEYFPLSEAEAATLGAAWRPEKEKQAQYFGAKIEVPENIAEVDESICDKVLTCSVTGKYFKIIPQELQFYKERNLPIPTKCPDQRHTERMTLRNPRKLWNRACDKCGTAFQTSYAPDRPEIVYCEKCYQEAVY